MVDGLLHGGNQQARPDALDLRVAICEHLGEVVAGVDVEHRKGNPAWAEGLGGQVEEDGGVLPSAEEQDGPFRLGGHLPDDEDRQRLEQVQVPERMLGRPDQGGHRGSGAAAAGMAGEAVVQRGAECGGGVHGLSSNHDHFGHVY